MRGRIFLLGLIVALATCRPEKPARLPIYGEREVVVRQVDGQSVPDTIFHTVPAFAFTNQENEPFTSETVAGKVYVADFFFTSCPTICPKMKAQLLRVYKAFQENPDVVLVSHTIDVRHDTVPVLKRYADKLGVGAPRWHFVTGAEDEVYGLARDYFVNAMEDKGAPGGYLHSGAFVLVDRQQRVRGHYDGTAPEEVDRMMQDMETLLQEP